MSNVIFFDYEDDAICNSDIFITPVVNGELPRASSIVEILFPHISPPHIANIVRMKTTGLNSGDICGVSIPSSSGTNNIPIFLINYIRGVGGNIPSVTYDERQIMKCMSIIENVASGIIKPHSPFLNAISEISVEYPTEFSGGLYLDLYGVYGTPSLTKFLWSAPYRGDINICDLPF